MDWQPIETHPKTEREPFLVYAPWLGARTNAMNVFKVWWDAAEGKISGFGGPEQPTHWMPMPMPPKIN